MRLALAALLTALVLSACGDETNAAEDHANITVVATTSVIGDIVRNSAAEDVAVEILIPAGADPHDYEPSPRARQTVAAADLVVSAGLGLEETLGDTIRSVDEEALFEMAASAESDDPHFWLDVKATAKAVRLLGKRLDRIEEGAGEPAGAYAKRLEELDAEVAAIIDEIPEARRQLVTGHEVLGPFADRYGLEVVGTISGTGSTQSEPSAERLAGLAELIEDRDIPAIFVAHGEESRIARALAAEVKRKVEIVELPVEALGEHEDHPEEDEHAEDEHPEDEHRESAPGTYEGMMRTIAAEIRDALA